MGSIDLEPIPLDLLKQDPSTGMYKLGSIEMTGTEYILAKTINDIKAELADVKTIKAEMTDVKDRLFKLENK